MQCRAEAGGTDKQGEGSQGPKSVTETPASIQGPRHIAIIMDGNRRWSRQRGLPTAVGHANGARRVRSVVQACADRGIPFLTLFAFSTENWARPHTEVSSLMRLLALYLQKEVKDMNAMGVRLRVVGNTAAFEPRIQALIHDAQANTAHNTRITLTLALNYGGRWDMLQAVQAWQAANPHKSAAELTEAEIPLFLSTAYAPEPDLLIRTGGEARVSNFMLWQLAYTEFFFTPVLWPAFTEQVLDEAIASFATRDRRFGGDTTIKPSLSVITA